jgi:prolyl-tRNA editing enzyme YbaK/EbsC (Cys-tRNA(Pro) deacylase)
VPETSDHAGIQRVREAAARKGVELDVKVFDQSTHTAAEAAAAVGAELGQIVKSLVFVAPGEGGALEPILCLIAGHNRVDLARLAAVTGDQDVRRATAREADELTGFSIGGIPPPVPPATLRTLANAVVAPITEERRLADVEAEREAGSGLNDLVEEGETRAHSAGA